MAPPDPPSVPARLPAVAAAALVMTAALALAGCASPAAPDGSGAGGAWGLPRFGTMRVVATPDEAFEAARPIYVTWEGGVYAIAADGEPDLARRTVVAGGTLYTTETGMGWTARAYPGAFSENPPLSSRVAAWDLPHLLADPALAWAGSADNRTFSGTPMVAGAGVVVSGWMTVAPADDASGGLATRVYLSMTPMRESPFMFVSAPGTFPWAAVAPATSKPAPDVVAGDDAAYAAHQLVAGWVDDYQRTHGGLVPATVDPQTLSVQVLASGKPWPNNPFDGQPVHQGTASGDLQWTTCGASDGHYRGLGWDAPLTDRRFGSGCDPQVS